jgi:tetratricopeptide (TPR) repeat protein
MRWESQRLTLLYAALGLPSEAAAGVSRGRVLEVVIEKVQSFGGSVEELGPTGLIAAFGLEPVEDAPRRAAHAALAIQNAVERGPHELGSRPIKLGIHVSQFLVGRGGSAPQVDLDAKRVAWVALEDLVAGAEAGTIVVSEAALPFLERRFDLVPITPADQVAVPAYRLVGHERSGFRVGRRMANFVGRRHEIAILRDHLASAIRGHGQVIGIVGGAGIGKSRLLYEFRRTLSGSQVRYLSGRCLPYWTGIPYSTVREILRQFCGVSEADTPEVIVAKVRRALGAVGMDPAERLPYLLALLGVERDEDRLALVSPEGVRSGTFETLRQMCLQGSRRRPIVFVGEDVHWIDRTSEECVASLVDNLAGAPILLVVTHRPGYRAPWSDKSYATQLALQPLSAEDSLSVVRSILGRPLPEALARPIVEKAEGNPFFLEELARAVGEQGDAQGLATVPGTIGEVLVARLGRLSEPARRLVECASVLGREFRLSLLRAAWDRPEPLDVALQELVRLEFLYEQYGEPGGIHAFTHGLTQEVAYESLPVTRRQALHLAVGQSLEAAYADRLEVVYDRLAHHYSRSASAEKAIDYLTRLAKVAGRGHAHVEAIRALEEALRHVEGLPAEARERRRLDLIRREAYSLIPLGRLPEILELLLRHQDGFERLRDPALLGDYHFLLCRTYLFLGESARAVESAERAIAEATRCGDEATLGKTYYLLAQQAPLSGRALEGIEHGRQAVARLERTGDRWWIGRAYWALGLNHAHVGEFEAALTAVTTAQANGEVTGDRHLQSLASWTEGIILAVAEGDTGIEACRRGLELSPDPFNTAIAQGWLGYAHLEQGDFTRAIGHLEPAVEQLGLFRFPQFQGWFLAFLADAYCLAGRYGDAREAGMRALGLTRAGGFLYGVGCAQRALGRIARQRGAMADAEAALGEAARTFESVRARHEVARTHLDLAAVLHVQDRTEAAIPLLEAAHRLFETLPAPRQTRRARAVARDLGVAIGA